MTASDHTLKPFTVQRSLDTKRVSINLPLLALVNSHGIPQKRLTFSQILKTFTKKPQSIADLQHQFHQNKLGKNAVCFINALYVVPQHCAWAPFSGKPTQLLVRQRKHLFQHTHVAPKGQRSKQMSQLTVYNECYHSNERTHQNPIHPRCEQYYNPAQLKV